MSENKKEGNNTFWLFNIITSLSFGNRFLCLLFCESRIII